jgi:hypothetical protein
VDDVGKKGAGILRTKPNIHWKKDRGKDVESAPWYPKFKGERINDHHLTLAEKQNVRQKSVEVMRLYFSNLFPLAFEYSMVFVNRTAVCNRAPYARWPIKEPNF